MRPVPWIMRRLPVLLAGLLVLCLAGGVLAEEESEGEDAAFATWKEAVAFLRDADQVHGQQIGLTGSTTRTYRAYEALRDGASPADLEGLHADPSPVVRVYVAWARLERREADEALGVALEMLTDTEQVLGFPGGCVGWEWAVGDWVVERAWERLDEGARQRLAERVVEMGAPPAALGRVLGTRTFPARLHARIRDLADGGTHEALVALARRRDPEDLPRVDAALRSDEEARVHAGLRAVAVWPHPSLEGAVVALLDSFRLREEERPRFQHAPPFLEALAALEKALDEARALEAAQRVRRTAEAWHASAEAARRAKDGQR